MASNTRLISGGTSYYLAGRKTAYTGSGTPWTAQATTPFDLSLNDATPIWTPAPAPGVPIFGGGPPFRLGRSLVMKSYDVVTETVGIQLRASSFDNACALLRLLRQILNTSFVSSPCILAVQPDGSTNTTYFEIYHADVTETPSYLMENNASGAIFRATITWTRSIGSAGALATAINAVSMRNRSTLSPDDVESLGALTGELINEGQPLNLTIAPAASADIKSTTFLATIYERVNASAAESKTTTTFTGYTALTPTITNARNRNLKIRILARFDTFTNPSKIRLHVEAGVGSVTYTSPEQALPVSTATSTLMDFGYLSVTPMRSVAASTLTLSVNFFLHSSDGTSVTARLDYAEILLYYTFATVMGETLSGQQMVVEQANDYNVNSIVVPTAAPRVYRTTSGGGEVISTHTYRGQLPRAINGASLYLAWRSGATADTTHDTTDTATVTAQNLALYHTLRGGTG